MSAWQFSTCYIEQVGSGKGPASEAAEKLILGGVLPALRLSLPNE